VSNATSPSNEAQNGSLEIGPDVLAYAPSTSTSIMTTAAPVHEVVGVEEPAYNFVTTLVRLENFRYDEDRNLSAYWSPESDNIEMTYLQPPFATGFNKCVFSVSHSQDRALVKGHTHLSGRCAWRMSSSPMLSNVSFIPTTGGPFGGMKILACGTKYIDWLS
jgi:hypothetical protein